MITASLVFDRAEPPRTGEILEARTDVGSADRVGLFLETNLIYGSELSAIVLTTADPTLDIDNKSIAFYIDNKNAIAALVKADSKRKAIAIWVILFWALVDRRGIAHWFESGFGEKIADLPTRRVKLFYFVTDQEISPFVTPSFGWYRRLSNLVLTDFSTRMNLLAGTIIAKPHVVGGFGFLGGVSGDRPIGFLFRGGGFGYRGMVGRPSAHSTAVGYAYRVDSGTFDRTDC